MNVSASILNAAINAHLNTFKERNLLANAISLWVTNKESEGIKLEDYNWTSELHIIKEGAVAGCVQAVENPTLTFWLPMAPDVTQVYHVEAVTKVFGHYRTYMCANPYTIA